MKNKLSNLVVVALCITMLPVPEVRAAKKSTVTGSMQLVVGQSKTIKVKGSYIKSKKYKTSNKKIATVTKKGKVTAKKVGKCKITVTLKYKKSKKYTTKKYTCNVTVKKKRQNKVEVTNRPVTTSAPPVEPNKPDITQNPTSTPNVTKEPTKTPDLQQGETDVPTVTPSSENNENGLYDPENKWCHHKYPGVEVELFDYYESGYNDLCYVNPTETTWYVSKDANITGANRTGDLVPICSKCGKPALIYNCYDPYRGDKFYFDTGLSFTYDGLEETYTQWNPEPSETKEGILDIYQGVNVYDMTEEEKGKNYKTINVVFPDGKKDKFFCIENLVSKKLKSLSVMAKSTAEKIGSITYPKYEVKTIDLGNGETTKVYGYYDREMADEVFDMVNEYRVENGLNELGTSDYIKSLSDIRSAEQMYTEIYNQQNTDYEYGGHERPNKTMCGTVAGENGAYSYGENAQFGTLIEDYQAGGLLQKIEITPEHIMELFEESEGHNENLLESSYNGVGISIFIGYPQNPDGTFKSYKVASIIQSFMK